MPFFSIIIPVYNCEKYLRQCVKSIIDQSFDNWELILVDDGSTDASGVMCDEFDDSRVCIIHKKNEGVAIARKTGIDKAIGMYVIFVDSDDWIEKNCLETIYNKIKETRSEIIRFCIVRENKDGSTTIGKSKYLGLYDRPRIISELFPNLIHNERAEYFAPSLCGAAFLRENIQPYMIANSRAKISEDGACVIPAVYHCSNIYFLDDNLYFYRYNNQSATKGLKVFDWDNPEIVAKHISENVDLNKYDFEQQLYRKVVHDVFNVVTTQFYKKDIPIREIYYDIKKNLQRPFYQKAIKMASFSGNTKARFMHWSLKQEQLWAIRLYSLYRKVI